MSNVSFGDSSMASYLAGITNTYSSDTAKTSSSTETGSVSKSKVSGKTIGEPQLSDTAKEYYEELKKKYSDCDFVLVSSDMKQYAQSQAASFANSSKMVVLIDEEKIERMATDENYRKQYEGIIANAQSGLSQLGSQISATGATVKGYGMQVNDNGTASYFAVLEKSSAAQRERIEKKAEEKKEEKKADAKKAEKEEQQERLEKMRDDRKSVDDDGTVMITASSAEELLQKIKDFQQLYLSDTVQTDENYRKQYEGIIANAQSGLSQLGSQISATGATVKGYGMQVNDNGTASYFAVLEKSSAAQRERIEKKAEEKKEEKKADAKKAEKEEQQERLEKMRDDRKSVDDDGTVMITASSAEELLQKIKDFQQLYLSDTVQTEEELKVGQSFDFSV